ncbi:FolC family protein [Lactobacillus pasteurii DSM 23907 = CRBIP 24.76]|uniref:tetrahydrofolate synthase n=1 Tax=Lactobacillus pasteurii DSM 23907 = CRBIP 24.76 TaxID=1423790 RepID=I7KLK9_9LACO|nr:folylpolyglutamate synthase/dihydrofolate synthase family protein [Lactobacillus pasteurii]KRK08706.1 FolC family protein [Lactobacillus pasteurii DSM 23907 = CRBIP 24.76]TDG76469.1 hypothetical protein C5L33_001228 [Lactobacillus pasteurii]CCI85439.1 FolC family protein [Lactobacillus pasteurii DSM 23907 = CRBIP 24.76]
MKFKTAKDVISYLYALPHLHPKNDLSFIKKVLQELGNPQDKVKTLHVTGTNGKGSTSYYLSNLLKKAGLKTGLFVSPYILEFNERIQINGQNIPNEELVEVANQVELAIEKIRRTESDFSLVTFEYEVAMAFLYFDQKDCDYAVIEVGIGGQHDKTNVIDPEASIITTIGLDHEKIIGPTIKDIAQEKSGIIKQKKPVVVGNIPSEVLSIIQAKASQEKAKLYRLGEDFKIDDDGNYQFESYKFKFMPRPKVENYDIALAVTTFLLLKIDLTSSMIQQAIDETVIPGRYQIINQQPTIILDGAHNVQAMQNLLTFLHQTKNYRKIKILITIMKDKDILDVFGLFDQRDEVFLTTIPYVRAAKKEDFPDEIIAKYSYFEDYQTAFSKLRDSLQKDDILLVTGSFYLVSAILKFERCSNESQKH